jgi:hypothetical protein
MLHHGQDATLTETEELLDLLPTCDAVKGIAAISPLAETLSPAWNAADRVAMGLSLLNCSRELVLSSE